MTKRRARRALHRFDSGREGRSIVYTTVTVPPHLRPQFQDPAVWRKFRRGVWRILRDRFGAELAIENSHPVGDESPDTFHPHLNFLWIPRKGFPPFIDVKVLRFRIRMLLETSSEIVLDSRYFQRKGKKDAVKRVQYALRNFPGWGSWAGGVQWYGRIVKLPPIVEICPKCKEAFLCVGVYRFDLSAPEDYYSVAEKWRAQESGSGGDPDPPTNQEEG